MEYDKSICPVVNIDGVIDRGKQYDLDITLPEDNRNIIYGIVKDCYKEPIKDAVVKLVEVDCRMGKDIRKPVSHTFTDENGEFVFGPLCSNRSYEVQIWVNNVKHAKICTECHRKGECLKGTDIDCKPMPPRPPKSDDRNDESCEEDYKEKECK